MYFGVFPCIALEPVVYIFLALQWMSYCSNGVEILASVCVDPCIPVLLLFLSNVFCCCLTALHSNNLFILCLDYNNWVTSGIGLKSIDLSSFITHSSSLESALLIWPKFLYSAIHEICSLFWCCCFSFFPIYPSTLYALHLNMFCIFCVEKWSCSLSIISDGLHLTNVLVFFMLLLLFLADVFCCLVCIALEHILHIFLHYNTLLQ